MKINIPTLIYYVIVAAAAVLFLFVVGIQLAGYFGLPVT